MFKINIRFFFIYILYKNNNFYFTLNLANKLLGNFLNFIIIYYKISNI